MAFDRKLLKKIMPMPRFIPMHDQWIGLMAEIYGKVATCVFYGVVLAVVSFGPSVGALTSIFTMPTWLMFALVIIALIATFVALLSYAPGTIRQFKENKAAKSEK